jgi:hypothetical protein
MEELRLKTAFHDETWHISKSAWSVNQHEGTIVFTTPDGLKSVAPVQIVGTYSGNDGTWLWGWDHPSVLPPLRLHAQRLLEYGRQNGIAALTTSQISCDEAAAWEFTALACQLCDAQGGYRGPAGTALVFMTFGEVTLRKEQGEAP